MKRILSFALAVVMIFAAFSLTACSENDSEGNATLVIATEEKQVYDIPLSKIGEGKGVVPALEYLKEEKGLEYDLASGYLNSIGGLANDYVAGKYIYIYTSVEKDFDVSEYKMEMEYEGKTLVSSGVGIEDMSLTDGAVVYIGLISWG